MRNLFNCFLWYVFLHLSNEYKLLLWYVIFVSVCLIFPIIPSSEFGLFPCPCEALHALKGFARITTLTALL